MFLQSVSCKIYFFMRLRYIFATIICICNTKAVLLQRDLKTAIPPTSKNGCKITQNFSFIQTKHSKFFIFMVKNFSKAESDQRWKAGITALLIGAPLYAVCYLHLISVPFFHYLAIAAAMLAMGYFLFQVLIIATNQEYE